LRALFLLLLLANLLFLAWTRWVALPPSGTPASARTQAGTTPIRLRGAGDPGTVQQAQAPVAPEPLLEAACVSWAVCRARHGGCSSGALTATGLRCALARVSRRGARRPLGSRAEPANAGRRGQCARSIADGRHWRRYVVGDGSPGNTVSLGIQHRARVMKLGNRA
jgi:hypothetical protein